jgi:HK97 gp10 family phage protein
MSTATPAIRIEGTVELHHFLEKLPAAVVKRIERQSLRKATKPTLDLARRLCPVDTGQLRRQIKIRQSSAGRGRFVRMTIGTAEGLFKGKQWYAGVVEFGHRIGARTAAMVRAQKRRSRLRAVLRATLPTFGRVYLRATREAYLAHYHALDTRAAVPPHPFLQPAFDQTVNQVAATMEAELGKAFDEAAR